MLTPKRVKWRRQHRGRMRGKALGSGKGNPEFWVAVVRPGRIMFEIAGVPENIAREALRLAANKLPIGTKFVSRADEQAVSA